MQVRRSIDFALGWPCVRCRPVPVPHRLAEKQVKELAGKVSGAFDGALGAASKTVLSTTASVQQEVEWVASRARQFYDTGLAHWQATEEQVFSVLKGADAGAGAARRAWCAGQPSGSTAAGASCLGRLLPLQVGAG